MDVLPSLVNVVIVGGIVITYVTRTQIRDLRAEIKYDISELRQAVRDLRSETVPIRGDLTQLALTLGGTPRPQTG